MLLLAKGRDQLRKQLKAWTPFSSHEKALRLSSSSLLRLSFFIIFFGQKVVFPHPSAFAATGYQNSTVCQLIDKP